MVQVNLQDLDELTRMVNSTIMYANSAPNAYLVEIEMRRMLQKLEMLKRGTPVDAISIDLGHGYLLAEKVDGGKDGTEKTGIVIGFQDYNGFYTQDLAMVSRDENEPTAEKAVCHVWADHEDENYTHRFTIQKHHGD